eukprot:959242-Pelagomonas_calceolata.AAC.10
MLGSAVLGSAVCLEHRLLAGEYNMVHRGPAPVVPCTVLALASWAVVSCAVLALASWAVVSCTARRKPKVAKGARDFMPDQMAIREVRLLPSLPMSTRIACCPLAPVLAALQH